MTASPMVLTSRASPESRLCVMSKNRCAMSAALTSPCASVSAVYPARSAKATVQQGSLSGIVRCRGLDGLEAEHHSTLIVLGDVAMRHPPPGVRDVQQDVDRLAGKHQHSVFPYEVVVDRVVGGEDKESSGAVHVERVRHRMVGVL